MKSSKAVSKSPEPVKFTDNSVAEAKVISTAHSDVEIMDLSGSDDQMVADLTTSPVRQQETAASALLPSLKPAYGSLVPSRIEMGTKSTKIHEVTSCFMLDT